MTERRLQDESPGRAAALGPLTSLQGVASAIGNRAFSELVARRTLARETDEGGYEFSDDPLAADGYPGDSSIRVKPGPARATLIRPPRLKDKEGYTFSSRGSGPGAWTQGFLQFFGFRPELGLSGGTKFWFNNRNVDFNDVIGTVVEQAWLDGVTVTREKAREVAVSLLPPGPPGPTKSRLALYLTFSFTRTAHLDPGSGRQSKPDYPGAQLALQGTWELHPENKSGPELSWVGQIAAGRDPSGSSGKPKLQSILTGPQGAYVFAFLDGSLQLAPLVQAMAGAVRGEDRDGIIRLVPAVQVGGGAQFTYVIPGTGEHLQVGGQAAAAFTSPSDTVPSSVDYGYQLFLQWKF